MDQIRTRIQKHVNSELTEYSHGRLLLAPRVGKTKLILDHIRNYNVVKVLWVTPQTKLAKEGIPADCVKWGVSMEKHQIETCTWRGLKKVEGSFDLIVLDEEQYITTVSAKALKKLQYKRILSMTGTETMNKLKRKLYMDLGLDVLYRITIKKAVDLGLISDYRIQVVGLPQDDVNLFEYAVFKNKKPSLKTEKKHYESLDYMTATALSNKKPYSEMLVIKRKNFIGTCPTKTSFAYNLLNELNGNKLLFAHDTKQASKLSHNVYNSKTTDEKLQKFTKGEINELVLVNSGGVGQTFENPIDNLIIIQTDSNTNGMTSQKICRALLSSGKHIPVIWVLCLMGTKDIHWIRNMLLDFHPEKVEFTKVEDLPKNLNEINEVAQRHLKKS